MWTKNFINSQTVTYKSFLKKKKMEDKIQLIKRWLEKLLLKNDKCHGIYFTLVQTKTNMLFMSKEQNVCVIGHNNAEIKQKFWGKT